MSAKKILLAEPRGFCSGVRRALGIVETLLRENRQVYVLHDIVHNHFVVRDLQSRGVVFAETLSDIPSGSLAVFSAHGVSPGAAAAARSGGLEVVDATCPLVRKLHDGVRRAGEAGDAVVLVGHAEHPEVEGVLGVLPGKILRVSSAGEVARLPDCGAGTCNRVSVFCQTTFDAENFAEILATLKNRFPHVRAAGSVCFATRERQDAVRELCKKCDFLLVAGSPHSSNSVRLAEIARRTGLRAMLADDSSEVTAELLEGAGTVGVTAGASAPECLVTRLVERLQNMGYTL